MDPTDPTDPTDLSDDDLDLNLHELIETISSRDLSRMPFPIMHVGITYTRREEDDGVVFRALVTATGVTDDRELEPIGVDLGDSESPQFWRDFVRDLLARGLHGTRALCSAEHSGLREAVGGLLPDVEWYDAEGLEDVIPIADRLGIRDPHSETAGGSRDDDGPADPHA